MDYQTQQELNTILSISDALGDEATNNQIERLWSRIEQTGQEGMVYLYHCPVVWPSCIYSRLSERCGEFGC